MFSAGRTTRARVYLCGGFALLLLSGILWMSDKFDLLVNTGDLREIFEDGKSADMNEGFNELSPDNQQDILTQGQSESEIDSALPDPGDHAPDNPPAEPEKENPGEPNNGVVAQPNNAVPVEQQKEVPADQKTEAPTEKKNEAPNEQKNEAPAEQKNEAAPEQKNEVPSELKNEVPAEQKNEVPAEQKEPAAVQQDEVSPHLQPAEQPIETADMPENHIIPNLEEFPPASAPYYSDQNYANEKEFAHLSKNIPQCANNLPKARSFIMIMTSHAGSTAIFSQLAQHPGVFWDHKKRSFEPLHDMEYSANGTLAAEWARNFFEEALAKGEMPGFKMEIIPILKAMGAWKQLIKDFDTRILFNYRKDHLKRAIGRYSYHYLGDHTAVGGINPNSVAQQDAAADRCSVGVGCSFEIDNMSNLHCIMTRSWKTHMYKVQGVKELTNDCALEVPYEDYDIYPDDVFHQSLDFLGLSRINATSAREKATSDKLCSVVKNYAQLCSYYAECPRWGWDLEDPEMGCSCKDYEYTSHGGPGVNPLCEATPIKGSDPWCYGICELCPETIEKRKIDPKWPY